MENLQNDVESIKKVISQITQYKFGSRIIVAEILPNLYSVINNLQSNGNCHDKNADILQYLTAIEFILVNTYNGTLHIQEKFEKLINLVKDLKEKHLQYER